MPDVSTAQLQAWLVRWNQGDRSARDELIRHTCDRLRRLTQHMLRDYQRVKQFEETDDIFQTVLLRLYRALEEIQPGSLQDYYRLAGVQIRRVLIDLARHYFGPEGLGRQWQPTGGHAEETTDWGPAYEKEQSTYEPARLADWSEFHRLVETLPDEERQAFDLLWYQELPQADAAALLGISPATLRRRWLSARLLLREALQDQLPPLGAEP